MKLGWNCLFILVFCFYYRFSDKSELFHTETYYEKPGRYPMVCKSIWAFWVAAQAMETSNLVLNSIFLCIIPFNWDVITTGTQTITEK